MKLNSSLLYVLFAVYLLSDPGGSGCYDCSTTVERMGTLQNQTLNTGEELKIIITERLFRAYNNCYDEVGLPSYFTPDLYVQKSSNAILVEQINDTLFIRGVSAGYSSLFLSVNETGGIDPEIYNQHLTITVK